ncbi:MAG TPA: chemotaxis protein CheW [Thermoanaerobaculia bacterium]
MQKGEDAPAVETAPQNAEPPTPNRQPATPNPQPATGNPQPATSTSEKLERFKEQAGTRRIAAETKTADQTAHHLELLTFLIAGEQYAIDIEKIVEIVTQRSITRIPNADTSVVGIISLRGTIVTLVDVRRKLRHPVAANPTTARIVVIDRKTETVGFVVDRVLRVVKIAPDEIEPHPVVHTTELEEAIRGVFRTGGALTILLDLDKLLDHSQWT